MIEPKLIDGYVRQYMKCKRCGQPAIYDYVPYSLSSAIRLPPCSHDFRDDYQKISQKEFLAASNAFRLPDICKLEAKPND